jgi:flavorubredoxin
LGSCKIQLVTEGVRAKWQPKPDDLAKCKELGKTVERVIDT